MKLTRAEFQMLTRRQMSWEEKAETCQANWHAYDQAVIEFVYQVNVELGGDHRWDASHSSDFLCRVMQFAEKEIPDCDYSLL
jgi:hypothetical protein